MCFHCDLFHYTSAHTLTDIKDDGKHCVYSFFFHHIHAGVYLLETRLKEF